MFCRNCGKEAVATAEFCPGCGVPPMKGTSYCDACGTQVSDLAVVCVKCGTRLGVKQTTQASPAPNAVAPAAGVSSKSRLAVTLLAFFLGTFGAHRFYAGKIGTAVTMLVLSIIGYATIVFVVGIVLLVAVGIWSFVDFIIAVVGKFKDKEGKEISDWQA